MKTKINFKQVYSIPNILCYIRILLIPIFIVNYITATSRADYYLAAGIIILSGVTDFLDGFIARKFNMITELGKAIDPIADKLTQAAIALSLMFRFKWMFVLVVIFLIKETTMGVTCLVLLKQGKKLDGALWYGKVATAVFYFTTIILIALPFIDLRIANTFILIASILLIFAFIMYMRIMLKMKNTKSLDK